MLHELGTNANKYGALSRPQGRVTITWTVELGMLRLSWLERGGPPVNVPASRGFGMTLIEQSAKGQGGYAHLSVEAEGIQWEIVLPLIVADASQRLPPAARLSDGESPPASRVARAGARLAGKRLLVVEDEPLVALDMVANLQEAGAEIAASVATVADALRAIESTRVDGALLDGNLHGEPVDRIAAALAGREIPFVFVSGYGPESLPPAFRSLGVLTKPFSPEELVEACAHLYASPMTH
jgi:CheY-like chemotaxis protein